MTAGKGVVHGEMFPLVNDKSPNPLKLFQIWLNLPRKSKMVSPAFAMVNPLSSSLSSVTSRQHWSESIPKITAEDGRTMVGCPRPTSLISPLMLSS
jgi:quercetin 2,3-dioxygenase